MLQRKCYEYGFGFTFEFTYKSINKSLVENNLHFRYIYKYVTLVSRICVGYVVLALNLFIDLFLFYMTYFYLVIYFTLFQLHNHFTLQYNLVFLNFDFAKSILFL